MLDKHILDSPEVGTDVRGLVVVSSDVGVCEVLGPDVGVEVRVDVKFDVGEGFLWTIARGAAWEYRRRHV